MPRSPERPTQSDFLKKVESTITTFDMVQSHDSILICVSGGPDSVAMLYTLNRLSSRLSLKLGIAHVNHQLRAEDSEMDEQFVVSLAKKTSLPFHLRRCDVQQYGKKNRLSLEDAARKVRYDFFFHTAKKHGYSKIATAHHQDDNAELILMNVIRGSGKAGISGIPPIRQGIIIRPLIQTSKHEILTFLSKNKLQYRLDQTNQDECFTRNRIRHRLIPELQSVYNPKIIEALNRMGSIVQMEENWIEKMVEQETKALILSNKNQSILISISDFTKKPIPLRRRIARKIIKKVKGDLKKITLVHVDEILLLTSKAVDSSQLHLPDNLQVEISGNQACFNVRQRNARPPKQSPLTFCYQIPKPDCSPLTIIIHEVGIKIKFSILEKINTSNSKTMPKNVALMDMDHIHFPLKIRNWIPGDRFTPLGITGTQKISRFFINKKVLKKDRSGCLLLLSEKRIIWLAGYQIDDSVKITPATNTILRAELSLA